MAGRALPLFPARAGMNRCDTNDASSGVTVPRTRGDEPLAQEGGGVHHICSPHARG